MAETKTTKKSVLDRQDDGTIKLTITIPQADVKKAEEEVVDDAVKNAKLPGFRPGKAPREMVLKQLDRAKLSEEVLKKLLPNAYIQAVTEHQLRPVMNPKIHIHPAPESKDKAEQGITFEALTCEAPAVDLKNYKDKVKDVTAKSKIVVPGKEEENKQPNFDEIMKAVLSTVEVKVPAILIQQEADRLLSQTLDEIKKLGLTLDQYLGSTNKTPEQFRKEYEDKARADMTLEFALQKIAEVEKLSVEEREINEAIQKAKDPKEREHMEKNRYLLASILRQQKTLDFLKNL